MVFKLDFGKLAHKLFRRAGASIIISILFLFLGRFIFSFRGFYVELIHLDIICLILLGIFFPLSIRNVDSVLVKSEEFKLVDFWNDTIPAYLCILTSILLSLFLGGQLDSYYYDNVYSLIPIGAFTFSLLLVAILDIIYYVYRTYYDK